MYMMWTYSKFRVVTLSLIVVVNGFAELDNTENYLDKNLLLDKDDCQSTKCRSAKTVMRLESLIFELIIHNPYHKYVVKRDSSGVATVTHSLYLNRIIHVDIDRQVLTIDAWQMWTWKDSHLHRLIAAAGERLIEKLEIPADLIWIPDVILYNSAASADILHHVKARVGSDGLVTYLTPAHVQTFCNMEKDVTSGDQITCVLKFGSWVYDDSTLKMAAGGNGPFLDLYSDFNRDWQLVGSNCTVTEMNGYSVIKYTLMLMLK